MDNVIVIDGDIQPEYGPVYGQLFGWSEKNDRWGIELLTRDGLIYFTSSDPASASAVSRVAEILRGAGGNESPNQEVVIRGGCLLLEAVMKKPFPDYGEDSCLEGVTIVNAARVVQSLITDCFKTKEALLAAIDKIAKHGGARLLAETDHFQLDIGRLEWSPQLHAEDIPVLARVLLIRDHLPDESAELDALYGRFADGLSRISSLRLELTCGKDEGFIAYAFSMFESEIIEISPVFDLLFLRQPWTAAALLQVANEGL